MRERQIYIERETNNSGWTRFDLTRQIETNLYIYRERERYIQREKQTIRVGHVSINQTDRDWRKRNIYRQINEQFDGIRDL